MKRNQAIKRIAHRLGCDFNVIAKQLKRLDPETQFQLTIVTSIEEFAKELVLKDYWIGSTMDKRPYAIAKEEIILSTKPTFSGLDKLRIKGRPIHKFKRSYFLCNELNIIAKRSLYRRGRHKRQYYSTNRIIVYVPSNETVPTDSRYFDTEREYGFHCKWWDTVYG